MIWSGGSLRVECRIFVNVIPGASMDLGLKDKLIVVTGGGAGIGAGISRACLAEGARVIVLGRRI